MDKRYGSVAGTIIQLGVVAAKMKISYGANALKVSVISGVHYGAEFSGRKRNKDIVS